MYQLSLPLITKQYYHLFRIRQRTIKIYLPQAKNHQGSYRGYQLKREKGLYLIRDRGFAPVKVVNRVQELSTRPNLRQVRIYALG